MRPWLQFAILLPMLASAQPEAPPRALFCPPLTVDPDRELSFPCGEHQVPRTASTRFMLIRTNLRENDGMDEFFTGLTAPLSISGGPAPSAKADYLIVRSNVGGEEHVAMFPLATGTRPLLQARFLQADTAVLDVDKARLELRRRIMRAPATVHARKYLSRPFRVGGYHLGPGTWEFTMLENPDGVDLLCIEDQALIARRRWWLLPAHIIPTDDKRSQGVISWDDPEAVERKLLEIRFPLKKALVLED